MATTESRSGFRLPWSADRAASRDGSEEHPDGSDTVGPELSEFDASGAATAVSSDATEAGVSAPPDAEPAGGVVRDLRAEPTIEGGSGHASTAPTTQQAPGRRPSKFLVDLTHAMQVAAEQARAATLEQFRVDGSAYVEQIQGRSVAEAEALRRRADDDVAHIKDWSKAEIARIRDETEHRIAGRRGQLDGQLARHATLVEDAVARIEGQIASFEAEMAAFFDELMTQTDLTVLAARAQQMPEAPAFDPPDDSTYAALLTEPAVGIPVAGPAPIAEPAMVADAAPAEPEAVSVVDEEMTQPIEASSAADLPFDRDAAMAAIQAAAEAAAALEATSGEVAEPEPFAEPASHGPDAGGLAHDKATPADDPRLAMLGLSPDFAAAEEAAAQAAAAELQEIPEMGEDDLTARLAGLVPSSASSAAADNAQSTPVISTQVVVTGLISVASIAGFKRHLGRADGVRHVGVSSGPDGEFLFTVQHEEGVALRDVIPTLPGFQARVTGGGDGVVTASAHDPED